MRQLLVDWVSLCRIADHIKETGKRVTSKIKRNNTVQVWELVEKSVAIHIQNKYWFIRVLYKPIEKTFYIDVRVHDYRETEETSYFVPTEEGICIPVYGWFKLIDGLFKLMRKYNE